MPRPPPVMMATAPSSSMVSPVDQAGPGIVGHQGMRRKQACNVARESVADETGPDVAGTLIRRKDDTEGRCRDVACRESRGDGAFPKQPLS